MRIRAVISYLPSNSRQIHMVQHLRKVAMYQSTRSPPKIHTVTMSRKDGARNLQNQSRHVQGLTNLSYNNWTTPIAENNRFTVSDRSFRPQSTLFFFFFKQISILNLVCKLEYNFRILQKLILSNEYKKVSELERDYLQAIQHGMYRAGVRNGVTWEATLQACRSIRYKPSKAKEWRQKWNPHKSTRGEVYAECYTERWP